MDARKILEMVSDRELAIDEAIEKLRNTGYEDLGFAKLDTSREERSGFPEVVFCSGKPDEYLVSIGAKRISASIGIGFPLWSVGTVINTTIEYTHRGSNAGLEDHSLRFTIGASIAENWFFKRRL